MEGAQDDEHRGSAKVVEYDRDSVQEGFRTGPSFLCIVLVQLERELARVIPEGPGEEVCSE